MSYEVFLSYRRADTEVATKIYQELVAKRRSVFFDTDALTSGDFEENILTNIKGCNVFVSLLTAESLRRMYENADTDMVRREIEAAKKEIKPKLFFMLLDDPATQKGQLYSTLKAYESDSLFVWLARQNIIECQERDEEHDGVLGIRGVVDKALQGMDGECRSLEATKINERVFIYNGHLFDYGYSFKRDNLVRSRYSPYGSGQAEEVASGREHLLYVGEWQCDTTFLGNWYGSGNIYSVGADETRRLAYSGHWDGNLKPKDVDGTLYDEQGAVRFRGRFSEVPEYGTYYIPRKEGQDVFQGRMKASTQEDYMKFKIEPAYGRLNYANGASYEGMFAERGGDACWWREEGNFSIPGNGFTLAGRGYFVLCRPRELGEEGWTLTVRFDDGEVPVTLIPSGQASVPYAMDDVKVDTAFYYPDGTRYRGSWEDIDRGWKRNDDGSVQGTFYNAEGKEFMPTKEQLEFYHAQGMALLAPLREFDPRKTAEELKSGPQVPRSLEEFRKQKEKEAQGQSETPTDYECVKKLVRELETCVYGVDITFEYILDIMGEEFRKEWDNLPQDESWREHFLLREKYMEIAEAIVAKAYQ